MCARLSHYDFSYRQFISQEMFKEKVYLNIWISKILLHFFFMVGSVYATDYSNASATGIFEPYTVCAVPQNVVAACHIYERVADIFTFSVLFQKCWNPTLCSLLSIPTSIYPPVKDTR